MGKLQSLKLISQFEKNKLLSKTILDKMGIFSSERAKIEAIFKIAPNKTVANTVRLENILSRINNKTFNIKRYVAGIEEFSFLKDYTFFEGDYLKTTEIKRWIREGRDRDKLADLTKFNNQKTQLTLKEVLNRGKRTEFYQDNKEFFQRTGGGNLENRQNTEWKNEVQSIYETYTEKEKTRRNEQERKDFKL